VWKIELSKQADKFTEREDITDDEIFSLVQKFINYSKGLNENIDVKKMKGKWKGYHRIRIGKIRMLVRVNFKERTILIDRIDYRGSVYK
jgi:mRNA interferase RelE/StbE